MQIEGDYGGEEEIQKESNKMIVRTKVKILHAFSHAGSKCKYNAMIAKSPWGGKESKGDRRRKHEDKGKEDNHASLMPRT